MIYRDFQDLKLSALGFGAMRLPVIGGDDGKIDGPAAIRMVDTAMEKGINYYDTAWGYHGSTSELVMGKALGKYPRDSFYLAARFPGYDPGRPASSAGAANRYARSRLKSLKCWRISPRNWDKPDLNGRPVRGRSRKRKIMICSSVRIGKIRTCICI